MSEPTRSSRNASSHHSPDDLVKKARTGDRAAFSLLVEHYHRRIYSFIAMRVNQRLDAEDLTQETFIRAWQAIAQYDPKYRWTTWLFTIAYRLVVSHYRQHRHTTTLNDNDQRESDQTTQPAYLLEITEESRQVWHTARLVLSEDQYDALWLRYAEELSVAEIAGIVEKNEGHIRVLLHRARQNVAAAIEQSRTQRLARYREEHEANLPISPRTNHAPLEAE